MPIDNPDALVEEFKKSGEFERLRRELLSQFQQDASYSDFKSRFEEIARQRLQSDQMLHYLSQEIVHKELMQEVDRFPIIEKAVTDAKLFSNPEIVAGITQSVTKILNKANGVGKLTTQLVPQEAPKENGEKPTTTEEPNESSTSDGGGLNSNTNNDKASQSGESLTTGNPASATVEDTKPLPTPMDVDTEAQKEIPVVKQPEPVTLNPPEDKDVEMAD